jgi:predicted nucleic acid-binding protein
MNGLGFSHSEMLREIVGIESLLTLLPDIPTIYPAWKALVRDYGVRGVKVHDARLVAIMSVYAVGTILTFNVADFERYGDVSAVQPAAVLA